METERLLQLEHFKNCLIYKDLIELTAEMCQQLTLTKNLCRRAVEAEFSQARCPSRITQSTEGRFLWVNNFTTTKNELTRLMALKSRLTWVSWH